jgi:peptidoglycan hydrolase CwlO-like protein
MVEVNYDKVYRLLKIVDLAKNWPNLREIHDLAMLDLEGINKETKAELERRRKTLAEEKAKAEAEAKAKATATAKAEEKTSAHPTPLHHPSTSFDPFKKEEQ